MDIKELKLSIENKTVSSKGIIFISKDTYIPKQYIYKIASIYNKEVEYVNSIDRLTISKSIFSFNYRENILVFITDRIDDDINLDEFCYVICSSKCKNDCAVVVPSLENWQILDYVITNSSKNIDKSDLEELVNSSKNMYLLDNEISKYNIFGSNQKSIFNSLKENFQFIKGYDSTIFDFTNALLDKDIDKVSSIYVDLDKYNFDTMAILSILYTQLKNIILVGFSANPTESNTGLTSKQIYWIRKNLYKYTKNRLISLFIFISDAESYIKNGLMSSKQLLDFIIINFLQEV